MKIKPNTWYFLVFVQAYIKDREWVDSLSFTPDSSKISTPEITAFNEFSKAFFEKTFVDRTEEEWEQFRPLKAASEKAYNEGLVQQAKDYTAERAAQVRERLLSGRMSLCPYFWSIVLALVIYYPIVRTKRYLFSFLPDLPSVETLDQISSYALSGFLALLLAGLIGIVGYAVYTNKAALPTLPAQASAAAKEAYQEVKRDWNASKVREEAAAQYAREHPEEARRRQEDQARYEAQQSAAERARMWRDLADLVYGLGVLALGIIGLIVAIAILFAAGSTIGAFVRFLRSLTQPPASGEPASVLARIAQVWRNFRKGLRDTREFIAAFLKAKKEKVCPFLEIDSDGPIEI